MQFFCGEDNCIIVSSIIYTLHFFSPVALQSLMNLGRLTYRRFLELFRHMVGLLERVISPSQGLYLHRTTQHRKTRTNIRAFSGIRIHDPSKNRPRPTPQTARPLWPASRNIRAINSRKMRRQWRVVHL
jgi:hypothetical protein